MKALSNEKKIYKTLLLESLMELKSKKTAKTTFFKSCESFVQSRKR